MDDLLLLVKKLQDSSGREEIPIEQFAEVLKTLSGAASSSSIWDLKMTVIQTDRETKGDADRAMKRHETLEEKLQDLSSRTDVKIDKVIDRVESLVHWSE